MQNTTWPGPFLTPIISVNPLKSFVYSTSPGIFYYCSACDFVLSSQITSPVPILCPESVLILVHAHAGIPKSEIICSLSLVFFPYFLD